MQACHGTVSSDWLEAIAMSYSVIHGGGGFWRACPMTHDVWHTVWGQFELRGASRAARPVLAPT